MVRFFFANRKSNSTYCCINVAITQKAQSAIAKMANIGNG